MRGTLYLATPRPKQATPHPPAAPSPLSRRGEGSRRRRPFFSRTREWFVDIRFPHEVANRGDTDRIHLVIDLLRNDAVARLAAAADSAGKGRLGGYLVKHALPRRVKRVLGIGN